MILSDFIWTNIRSRFSLTEQLEISAAHTGSSICPRGFIVDEHKISKGTREKLEKFKTENVQNGSSEKNKSTRNR